MARRRPHLEILPQKQICDKASSLDNLLAHLITIHLQKDNIPIFVPYAKTRQAARQAIPTADTMARSNVSLKDRAMLLSQQSRLLKRIFAIDLSTLKTFNSSVLTVRECQSREGVHC